MVVFVISMPKCTQYQGSLDSFIKGKRNNTDTRRVASDDQAGPSTKKMKTILETKYNWLCYVEQ